MQSPINWWGEFDFQLDESAYWHVGALQLWVKRVTNEWQVHSVQDSDPFATGLGHEFPASTPVPEAAQLTRISFTKTGSSLSLKVLLGDRAYIIRPEIPLVIPAGESVQVFASTPVWLSLGQNGRQLLELPAYRSSDTWFGPSTIEGELAYASRSAARVNLAEIEFRPHRAVTPISVRNQASDALILERLRVPVQYLHLYGSETGLWTQAVVLERQGDGEFAAVQLQKSTLREAGRVKHLAEPRQQMGRNVIVRAFSRLFKGES